MITFSQHIEESLRKPELVDIARQGKNAAEFTSGWMSREAPKHNWELLGRGSNGAVFKRPNDPYVLKVFETNDYGYKTWLKFCEAHPTNSFVPKFRGKPTPINSRLAVVRMEILSPIESKVFQRMMDWWMHYSMVLWTRNNDKVDDSGQPITLDRVRDVRDSFPTKQPITDLIKCMAYLDNITNLDLHHGNVMVRSNGDIVITDPMWRVDEVYPTKYTKDIENFLNSRFDAYGRMG